MDAQEWLAQGFEANRAHLRAVAGAAFGFAAVAGGAYKRCSSAARWCWRGWPTAAMSTL